MAGDAREALRLRRESIRIAERFGELITYGFARRSLVFHLYHDGRWDEAVQLAGELVSEREHEPLAGESYVLGRRALIQHARGDDAGALEDARRGLEIARPAKDPQMLLPALTTWHRIAVEHDLDDEIERTAKDLLHELTVQQSAVLIIDALLVARSSGLAEDLRRLLEAYHSESPWMHAGLAILDERWVDAAETLETIGDFADEAFARLRAAEQLVAAGCRAEAEEHLQRALAFYRSVGATRYSREAEALLAASA
jgi:tetratricopeptide (TPR) repeat protein